LEAAEKALLFGRASLTADRFHQCIASWLSGST
jgi:hypothetical protein